MKASLVGMCTICVVTVTALLLPPSFAVADAKAPGNAKQADAKQADAKQAAAKQADAKQADAKQVEFFAAMNAGDIGVKFIPKDAKEANLLIENKANKPLKIKLPEAFAGVPEAVLAQPGMGMGGMGGMGNMGGMGGGGMGGGMQGMGGGMGGMGGMGMGGMGGMGGMFNVAPDKVGKIKVPVVCLEHGKRDPNPRVPYAIVPIESFTKNQQVIEVCKMLGHGQVPRNTAQAAVWHLASGLSWAELASKDKVRLSNGYSEKYFSPQEIVLAARVVSEATRRAEKSKKDDSADPAKYDSLSQK